MRDRAEAHTSALVWDGDFSVAEEQLDAGAEPTATADDLERARIEAGMPAWGNEIDESILPAEAGLDRTHISFTKGCYPGQEPVAGCTTAGTRTAGCACCALTRRRARTFATTGRSSGA